MSSIGETTEVGFILSGIKILEDLKPETLSDIARRVKLTSYQSGEKLIRRGRISDRLIIIFSGEVEVVIPDMLRGVARRVNLQKGAVVGEISLLTRIPASSEVIALTDTSVLYLDRKDFEALVEQHKSFADTMTSLISERMAFNGGINKVGNYHLLNKLGEGSMAIVFNAYDSNLERDVAIKMLKYNLSHDKEFLIRFEREAKTIAGLNHPNIVNVYEIINEFSTRFMVMEKLSGMDLAAILKQKGTFNSSQTRFILYQVALALEYAHNHGEHGIVHRDIKPSNIIINPHNHVKITDFGIARPARGGSTEKIEGTPHYLAPEIIQSKPVDGRADIYAMGIMGFHMLSGSPPFTAKSLPAILDMHVRQKPPNIRNYCQGIDEDLAQFIDQALVKDVDKRISNWRTIKSLLKPGGRHDQLRVAQNEIVFVTRMVDSSYQDAAGVINSLKKVLEQTGIEHSINLLREDRGEDTMDLFPVNPDET
jgi:serine/threonine protein kinase